MTLVSGGRYLRRFPGVLASNSGIVENGNFQRFCWLFLGFILKNCRFKYTCNDDNSIGCRKQQKLAYMLSHINFLSHHYNVSTSCCEVMTILVCLGCPPTAILHFLKVKISVPDNPTTELDII